MKPIFLTEQEVKELTGVRRAPKGKTVYGLQVKQLEKNRVPYFINCRGRPIVALAAIEGARQNIEPEPTPRAWSPSPAFA